MFCFPLVFSVTMASKGRVQVSDSRNKGLTMTFVFPSSLDKSSYVLSSSGLFCDYGDKRQGASF